MVERKGFVSTLEAVIASTIFFVFLINVLPSLVGQPVTHEVSYRITMQTLESLDSKGFLRDKVISRDPESIHQEINKYVSANTAVEILYMDKDGEMDYELSGDYPEDFKISAGYAVTVGEDLLENGNEVTYSVVSVYIW